MKILQILNPSIPLPPTTVGGVERIVQYLVDELLNAGHEITLMAHSDSKVPKGIKLIGLGTYTNHSGAMLKVWMHLLFNRYDVIHNHGRLLYFLPALWGKTRKVHTTHMAELGNKAFLKFLRLKPKNLCYTPCGKWIKDKFQHLGGEWNYVNNGLPINLYHFENKTITSESPLVIICRMGPGKGLLDAIKIAKSTNKNLIIAGRVGDYPHEIEWFEQHVNKFCDGVQIKFIGPVTDSKKNELLNQALALIIPTNESEAFNTTMIEANACGCPVISYNKYCFPEFVINGTNGYLGDTIEDLKMAVNQVINIDRKRCRDVFENFYTSKTMTNKYLTVYTS